MWAKIQAFLALLFGRREGRQDQRQADQLATLKVEGSVEHAISHAEAVAPVDRADVADELRRHEF